MSVRRLSVGFYTPAQVDAALREVFGIDTQLIVDGTYYVITIEDRIAGAGGWSGRRTLYGGDQAKQPRDDLLDPAVAPARIRAFFVHPDWARRGLGRRLFAACERAARARGFTRFELMATLPGEPLYRALGFESKDAVSVGLGNGLELPCVRMERAIQGGAPPASGGDLPPGVAGG